jgi:ketosteroid isomerase-like protein
VIDAPSAIVAGGESATSIVKVRVTAGLRACRAANRVGLGDIQARTSPSSTPMPKPVRIPYARFAPALVFLSCGCTGAPGARGAADATAQAYIVDCSHDWAASVVTGDRSKRRVYFADDFVGTDTKGRHYDKATVTRETGPARNIVSNRLDDVKVRFFGDTAIAHGSESWQRKDGSKGRYVWTDVWALRNGEWQIVAAQDADAVSDSQPAAPPGPGVRVAEPGS